MLNQQGIAVNGSKRRRTGCWRRARIVTGTSTIPSGERWMGWAIQRCRRFQLGEFHVSDGLEIDSCNDLIFRQSDQTIAGITTRVDIFGRLKAEFLPFSSTKSFQHHSRLCSIRFFRHCSSQQLNTATVIIAATKNTSRCHAAGSSGTAKTGPSVIFIPFRHAELGS